jgi:hypothetical protein
MQAFHCELGKVLDAHLRIIDEGMIVVLESSQTK